ncbi:MAG: type IV pilus secretin PilQ [Acidobacteria bacterium]|nr:type IV pilus secretin PilQ [Acidobacteriota bacterium]
MGDEMMVKNARILLVVAVALVAAAGFFPGPASAGPAPRISALQAEAGAEGPVVHLAVSGSLDTVHYSPQPGVWIVEMPDVAWEPSARAAAAPALGITRAELSSAEEFGGRKVTRLTVWLDKPAQADLATVPDGLELRFKFFGADTGAPAQPVAGAKPSLKTPSGVAVPPPQPVVPEPVSEPVADAEPSPATADAAPKAAPAAVAPGDALLAVDPVAESGGVVVALRASGPLHAKTFTLPSPDRIVVDLPGVINRVQRHVFPVHSGSAVRVRVAQHRVDPTPITRLVIDLDSPAHYEFTPTADGGVLRVGVARRASEAVGASAGTIDIHPSTTEAAAGTAEPSAGAIDIHPARAEAASSPDGGEPVAAVAETAGTKTPAADAGSAGKPIEIGSAPEVTPPEPGAAPQEALPAPGVEAPKAAAAEPNPWEANPDQLVEQAPAAQVLTEKKNYAAKELTTQERQFTGEPITLTLKDADIKDVLRTFATLTNLNIVVDPGVGGTVTVELHDVPWDQALDLILRINGLDYVLENNVLRVAPIQKLAAEKRAAAQFKKEQELAKPLKVVLKPVSYAKAQDIEKLLKGDSQLLSDRGTIQVDNRTNTLIIRDTVDRVDGVLRLIDSLDKPTPQVVIEGRIVETTRDFSHALGINWGFTGVMDAEHGNDTGLKFPNSIKTEGGVNLGPTGVRGDAQNGSIALTFGDILNTFNLDFTLSAAESDGLVKIVSSPRVTTQNMKKATIRSGLQIPVQTVANNTVTVQYIDATLKLDVTPQITAEGTVMLQIDIKKQEPILAAAIQGGRNAPIFTRDAKTNLLIRDGGTTVIGGIYQMKEDNSEDRVPGLAKIPILGFFFKSKKIFNRHDELLIFITPRIVKY